MSLAHLLDDFLDTIDYLPSDLSTSLNSLSSRDAALNETQKHLAKRRRHLLQTKDAGMLKRVAREARQVQTGLLEKIREGEEVGKGVSVLAAKLDALIKDLPADDDLGSLLSGVGAPKGYCVCKGPSDTQMLLCEGECPTKWFHLECVGLKEATTKKWLCPQCSSTQPQI